MGQGNNPNKYTNGDIMSTKNVEEAQFMVYNFEWKEIGKEWQKLEVVGHKYYEETDRMVLFKENGGIFEVPCWNTMYSSLGKDWADKVKKQHEEELSKGKEDAEKG